MKTKFTILLIFAVVFSGFTQDIDITFTGSGAEIDSVSATNQRTGESITFPGSETLTLSLNTGILLLSEQAAEVMAYPNPFSGSTSLKAFVSRPQTMLVRLYDMTGRVIAETSPEVIPGLHEFEISTGKAGIYWVSISSEEGIRGFRLVCSQSSNSGKDIRYLGMSQNDLNSHIKAATKAAMAGYTLAYTMGDIILYSCHSGTNTTIITDSPSASTNYEVGFFTCTDPDEKDYSVVKIGDQVWMAENLAYLPAVSQPGTGSVSEAHYYVYSYQGTSIEEARATGNYGLYGVLYNWPAAMNGASSSSEVPSGVRGICPDGWHLPSNYEWTALTDYLTENGYGFGGSGNDISKSMAFSSGWVASTNPGSTGYDQASNNSSGFSALPGGKYSDDDFKYLGTNAHFWSATGYSYSYAYSRIMLSVDDKVARNSGFTREEGLSVRCVRDRNEVPLPIVTTAAISGITQTTATGGGNVTDAGAYPVTQRGVCWSKDPGPTTDDHHSVDGTGAGSFVSSLTGLDPGTDYYVRAYATNSAGTAYGGQIKFTTAGGGGQGTFTDPRDGNQYDYKTIGSQTWMVENMAWIPSIKGPNWVSTTIPYYYVYDYYGTDIEAAKATENYATYGMLYNWIASLTACPEGWHLPTKDEWMVFMDYLSANGYGYGGSGEAIGKALASTTGWQESEDPGDVGNNPETNNSSGFNALPAGTGGGGNYGINMVANFWSATEEDSIHAWYWHLFYHDEGAYWRPYGREYGYSVRCLKGKAEKTVPLVTTAEVTEISINSAQCGGNVTDIGGASITERGVCWSTHEEPTVDDSRTIDGSGTGKFTSTIAGLLDGTTYYVRAYATNGFGAGYGEQFEFTTEEGGGGADGTFTDSRDGNEYEYKIYGTQTWMIGNLAYLPSVSPSADGSETSPYYHVYGYEGSDVEEAMAEENYLVYGALYNWAAAVTACPDGWHLPSEEEWTVLAGHLVDNGFGFEGSGTDIGKSMASQSGWTVSETQGHIGNDQSTNNSSYFNARPAGVRGRFGGFTSQGQGAWFWSADEGSSIYAWNRNLYYLSDGFGPSAFAYYKTFGYSVRCVQNE